MSIPKKHHYIPRMYLNGFCRNGNVWVYDRQKGAYEQRNPKNLATRKHFYTVVNPDGTKDPGVEHALGSIENATAPVIRKIDAASGISLEEKFHLALFVALMKFRVPFFESWFADFSDAFAKKVMTDNFPSVEAVQRQLEVSGKNDPADPDQAKNIFEGLRRGGYKVVPNAAARLAQMLQLAYGISREISLMEWTFANAPSDGSFVTSDNPVLILSSGATPTPPEGWKADFDPYALAGEGFGSPGTRKVMPLTQRVGLIIGDYGSKMKTLRLNKAELRGINEEIAVRCDRYLIARDEALLRRIAQKIPAASGTS